MHDAYIGGRSENNIKCVVTISGGRTKQLDIFCCVTGFTSDFLSFIVVELIQFFHGAIQLKGSMKELNIFHNYETEKIARKASDAAENLQLYRVVRFFHPRSSCTSWLQLIRVRRHSLSILTE